MDIIKVIMTALLIFILIACSGTEAEYPVVVEKSH